MKIPDEINKKTDYILEVLEKEKVSTKELDKAIKYAKDVWEWNKKIGFDSGAGLWANILYTLLDMKEDRLKSMLKNI